MLSDSQKAVFKMVADNKAMYECLKEFLLGKFALRADPQGLSDSELGAFTRAQYEGFKRIEAAFSEIASFKTQETYSEGVNPAR